MHKQGKKLLVRFLSYLPFLIVLFISTSVVSIDAAQMKNPPQKKSQSLDKSHSAMPRVYSDVQLKTVDHFPRFHKLGPHHEKTVYLTFDDGPHQVSQEILAILDRYEAKATFFMLDGNIKKHPDAVKKMAKAGHALGMHGVTHDKQQIYESPKTVIKEMDQVRKTIKAETGIETNLLRTPYGSAPYMKANYKKAVSDHGYMMWDWSIDSMDWYYRDHRLINNTIEQLVIQEERNQPLVILLHEQKETVKQLPKLLEYLSKQQYDMKALDAAMTPSI